MDNILNITAIYELGGVLGRIDVPIDLNYFHSSWCDEEILDNIYPQVFDSMNKNIQGEREFLGLDMTNEQIIEHIHNYFS